ncbi:hypothetical protein [Leptospira bouyouniensis]|uniref:hypothetical protein n=1 Tax=Leptospira bouyouniensis TaxID=2484911 RepID=UPI001090C4AF|nr:hypothetical protein [Leptospira bouyouniensis]TGM74579.1 hypothetical protein EHQ99_18115 [Leptospira bouyouniensis]
MSSFTDHHLTKTEYLSQRDNINPYFIEDEKVFDKKGKYLFDLVDFEKYEHLLYDRVTKCFISTGSMFCGFLHERGIIKTIVDEVAYELALDKVMKKGETRFHWEVHKRLFNNVILKDSDFTFEYEKATLSAIQKIMKKGDPLMISLFIKPWYPSGKGHLTLGSGYREDLNEKFIGVNLKDPFGKLLTNYRDHDGDNSFVPIADFKKAINGPSKSPCHIGFLQEKK